MQEKRLTNPWYEVKDLTTTFGPILEVFFQLGKKKSLPTPYLLQLGLKSNLVQE